MVSPYQVTEIVVNKHNYEETRYVDGQKGRIGLTAASDSYQEITELGKDNINETLNKRKQTFRNDTRDLKFIKKTDINIDTIENDEEQKISEESVDFLLNDFSENLEVQASVCALRQQIGNNITFSAPVNYSSSLNGFVFNSKCQPVTSKNSLEISNKLNIASKISESKFYYLIKESDKSTNPVVAYLDKNGVMQKARLTDMNDLIKKNKCSPLLVAVASAEIRVNKDNEIDVTTNHKYFAQPEFLSYTGPQYPGITSKNNTAEDQFEKIKNDIFMFQNKSYTYKTLLTNKEIKNHHNILQKDIDLFDKHEKRLSQSLQNLVSLRHQYIKSGIFNRKSNRREYFKALSDMQLLIDKIEQNVCCQSAELKLIFDKSEKPMPKRKSPLSNVNGVSVENKPVINSKVRKNNPDSENDKENANPNTMSTRVLKTHRRDMDKTSSVARKRTRRF